MKLKTEELYHLIDLLSLNSIEVRNSKLLQPETKSMNIAYNSKLTKKLQKQLIKKENNELS